MKRFYKINVLLLSTIVAMSAIVACKRTIKNDEVLGPGLISAPSDFTGVIGGKVITKVWSDKPTLKPSYHNTVIDKNFDIRFGFGVWDRILFEGDLSHEVSWNLRLEGVKSHAQLTFSGTGNKINADTLKWDGKAEGYRFFLYGEKVAYTLSFIGSAITYVDTLSIKNDKGLGPKSYKSGSLLGYLDNGDSLIITKLDDFESAGGIQTSYSDAADGTKKVSFYTTPNQRVEGYLSFYMKGTDLSRNNYLGGASDETLTSYMGLVKKKDPSKVFINAYIYGFGKPNSSVFFQIYENDSYDPGAGIIPTTWDKTKNDMWQYIQQVDWIGWKLVSIPYSSFKPANNPLSGGNGNRVLEPHKISGAGIEAESYPNPGYEVELGMDLYCITENGPFQP